MTMNDELSGARLRHPAAAHHPYDADLVELTRLALHGPRRELELYVQRLANQHAGTLLGSTLAAMVGEVQPVVGPHSRACGWRDHEHGPACHGNCPTCHGR